MCHERGQHWRDGVSCQFLGNKPPQNVVPRNNEQLLSPFPRPRRVGLAESHVRLQTRGWLVPHHQQARLGTRICFQTHSRAAADRGSAGCRPNRRAARVSPQRLPASPKWAPRERKAGSRRAHYNLASESTHHPFCSILSLGSESSPVHSEREGVRLHFGRKNIRGFMDLFYKPTHQL